MRYRFHFTKHKTRCIAFTIIALGPHLWLPDLTNLSFTVENFPWASGNNSKGQKPIVEPCPVSHHERESSISKWVSIEARFFIGVGSTLSLWWSMQAFSSSQQKFAAAHGFRFTLATFCAATEQKGILEFSTKIWGKCNFHAKLPIQRFCVTFFLSFTKL